MLGIPQPIQPMVCIKCWKKVIMEMERTWGRTMGFYGLYGLCLRARRANTPAKSVKNQRFTRFSPSRTRTDARGRAYAPVHTRARAATRKILHVKISKQNRGGESNGQGTCEKDTITVSAKLDIRWGKGIRVRSSVMRKWMRSVPSTKLALGAIASSLGASGRRAHTFEIL